MNHLKLIAALFCFILCNSGISGQPDPSVVNDRVITDSIPLEIRNRLSDTKKQRDAQNKIIIDSLRKIVKGSPVLGVMNDTVFYVYSKLGSSNPAERADRVTKKIKKVYEDEFFNTDSITIVQSDYTVDVVYGDIILIGLSEIDALWYEKPVEEVAYEFKKRIEDSILLARKNYSLSKLLTRIGLVILVFCTALLILWLIGKASAAMLNYFDLRKEKLLKKLSYKDYTFLSEEQELAIIHFLIRILKWILFAILLYITLPVIFSIFPFTRGWADSLFRLIWSPFRGILVAIWKFLPDLFTIIIIIIVIKLLIRFVKYVFTEMEAGKLKISGFHADWAMPTFSIVRFLLYAFMFILIFPHIPGSNSPIFKGVSVFLGVLLSLGSTSAVANTVAGLVITYMRPFKLGDRIKIGDITGDVIEKTLLVTRIRTIKNEEITIPNTSVLTGSTTNFSSFSRDDGLIIYTTVTIGYDVPWREMHKALVDAALQTDMILSEPVPFVLQTSLDDFYVSYQVNAFTHEPNKMAEIYSMLHQNIQDVCNERGIEIMSPHYRSERDGNITTIPADYLSKDYKPPSFSIKVEK